MSSFLTEVLLCLLGPVFLGFVSSSLASGSLSSFFTEARFRFEFAGALLASSLLTSLATGPVFFCTLGTTALVLPPTVRKVIFSPFGSTDGVFFLPLLHRCLNSQSAGNFSESARSSTEVEQI